MFNTEDLNKAREHFSEHRYAVIDNILLPKYIKELYKSVTTIDYGYWACNGETHLKFNHNEDKNFKEIRDNFLIDFLRPQNLQKLLLKITR
jgi:hypothetical protein